MQYKLINNSTGETVNIIEAEDQSSLVLPTAPNAPPIFTAVVPVEPPEDAEQTLKDAYVTDLATYNEGVAAYQELVVTFQANLTAYYTQFAEVSKKVYTPPEGFSIEPA